MVEERAHHGIGLDGQGARFDLFGCPTQNSITQCVRPHQAGHELNLIYQDAQEKPGELGKGGFAECTTPIPVAMSRAVASRQMLLILQLISRKAARNRPQPPVSSALRKIA